MMLHTLYLASNPAVFPSDFEDRYHELSETHSLKNKLALWLALSSFFENCFKLGDADD